MFDLSWSEILVIAVVAVVFIGPKELPGAIRTVGKWMGKARSLARDFQNQVDDVVREAELDELRKEADKYNPKALLGDIEKTIDPKGELAGALQPPTLPNLNELAAPSPQASPSSEASSPPAPTAPSPPVAAPQPAGPAPAAGAGA